MYDTHDARTFGKYCFLTPFGANYRVSGFANAGRAEIIVDGM